MRTWMEGRRWWVALCLWWGCVPAWSLTFAINEGVTYRVLPDEIRAKYTLMAADLSKLLGQPVTIEPVSDYPTLRAGLKEGRWELAIVHPAHISIQAIRHSGYQLLAVTTGFTDYKAQFLVKADSPLKSLAELGPLRLGAPDEDSITSMMVRASLRDAKLDPSKMAITYTRYQDAVPFFVEKDLAHVGATAAGAIIKSWKEKGGKILAVSKSVPIKHVLASSKLPAAQVDKVKAYFLGLNDSEAGKKALAPTKWKGFEAFDQAEMLKLGDWLGV